MTRPIYIERLRRMITPPQYALLEHFRLLYGDGDYHLDDAGCLAIPELRDPKQLSALLGHSNRDSELARRFGRCNWLDQIGDPPVDGSLEEAQAWLIQAVEAMNDKLRMIGMFED